MSAVLTTRAAHPQHVVELHRGLERQTGDVVGSRGHDRCRRRCPDGGVAEPRRPTRRRGGDGPPVPDCPTKPLPCSGTSDTGATTSSTPWVMGRSSAAASASRSTSPNGAPQCTMTGAPAETSSTTSALGPRRWIMDAQGRRRRSRLRMVELDWDDDDVRVDPYLGTVVHVVGARQARPNLPSNGCPFCPGGLEAPHPYDVHWFAQPLAGDARRPVRGGAVHLAARRQLLVARRARGPPGDRPVGASGSRRWVRATTSTTCSIFENRGAEVGATIAHPHGQIYAYDHVPERPLRLLEAGWAPDRAPGDRLVADARRMAGVGPGGQHLPGGAGPGARRAATRHRLARRPRAQRVGRAADRRARPPRPPVRRAAAVHAVVEPTADRRRRRGRARGSTSRSSRRGGKPAPSASSPPPSWPAASTSTR